MSNPFVMGWIKMDVDKLLEELSAFAVYFDEKILLINRIKLAIEGKKYDLFVNTPSSEFRIVVLHSFYFVDKKKINNYGLSLDCYPYEVHHVDISRKQYFEFVKLFKKIEAIRKKKKDLFAKNRVEMIGKICKLVVDSKKH